MIDQVVIVRHITSAATLTISLIWAVTVASPTYAQDIQVQTTPEAAGEQTPEIVSETSNPSIEVSLNGLIHADARWYLDDSQDAQTDTFLVRRARIQAQGGWGEALGFRIMADLGQGQSQLVDAYADWRFAEPFQLRIGRFKAPLGLELLQSASARILPIGLATGLVPNRDLGVQVSGRLARRSIQYQLAAFNGAMDGASSDFDLNDAVDVDARLFLFPFRWAGVEVLHDFGLGIAASYGNQSGSLQNTGLPRYRTLGRQTIYRTLSDAEDIAATAMADGVRYRLTPQLYYYVNRFGLQAEYTLSSQEVRRGEGEGQIERTLTHHGWQVQVSALLTRDEAVYAAVKPHAPFDPGQGGWGAIQLVGRVAELRLDEASFPDFADPEHSAQRALAFTGGVLWYLAEAYRLALYFERTQFEGGAEQGGDRASENLLLARMQLSF